MNWKTGKWPDLIPRWPQGVRNLVLGVLGPFGSGWAGSQPKWSHGDPKSTHFGDPIPLGPEISVPSAVPGGLRRVVSLKNACPYRKRCVFHHFCAFGSTRRPPAGRFFEKCIPPVKTWLPLAKTLFPLAAQKINFLLPVRGRSRQVCTPSDPPRVGWRFGWSEGRLVGPSCVRLVG